MNPTSQTASSPGTAGQLPADAGQVIELIQRICPVLDIESVSLDQAMGRVLRRAVVAPEDQPAFDRSAMDGYAVRCDDPATEFRVIDEIRAGDWKPRKLDLGEAVRIATGGAVPGEGLEVVPIEDVSVESDILKVKQRPTQGHGNLRRRGEDARAGDVLIEAGTRLSFGAIALAASVGCGQIEVTRLPRVLHVATGNELVPPGASLMPGQIYDSNSTLVRAFLLEWGIDPIQLRVPEDEAVARAQIEPLLEQVDLLLISGGASVGKHDFTRQLFEQFGFPIHVSRTRTRPGKPLIVAGPGCPIALGLPGNPLAHFVCLNIHVRAVLKAFAGLAAAPGLAGLPVAAGRLAQPLHADAHSRETFWPATEVIQDGQIFLTPLRWSSSGDLTSLAQANALIHLAGATEHVEAGTQVSYISTQRFS